MPESRSRKKPAYVPPAQAKVEKGNPRWLVPTMLGLMILGLVLVVVTYITQTAWPVPNLGNWNLVIGFALIIAGFGLTTRWR